MVWFELWCHRIKWCDQLLHHKKSCHKVWMIPLYAMTPLIMLYKVYVSFISGSSQDVDISSWLILMAPFDGESISFSTKSTILVIGLLRFWLPLCESATQTDYADSLVLSISRCHQEYSIDGFAKTLGGGMTTFVFIVNMLIKHQVEAGNICLHC